MSFIEFLEESLDFPSPTARFAKILFADVDNGCGSYRFNAVTWKAHFIKKHSDSPELVDMLILAYIEYVKARKRK